MALQNVGKIIWPDRTDPFSGLVVSWNSGATNVLSSTNTRIAAILPIPADGDITGIVLALSLVTTPQDAKVSILTLDSSGNITGTAYKGSAFGTLASGSQVVSTMLDVTLGTQATAAVMGDYVAVVIEWVSTQGSIRLANSGVGTSTGNYHSWNGSAWTKASNVISMVGFKYSDGTYKNVFPVAEGSTAATYHIDTAGADEYGLKIVLPFKGRCIGAMLPLQLTPTNTILASLYQGTTNLRYAKLVGPTFNPSGTIQRIRWSSPVTLDPGTYYLTMTNDSSASNCTFAYATVQSNAQLGTFPGGTGCYLAKRVDGVSWSSGTPSFAAVSWTEVNTQYAPFSLVFDQLDDAANVGGRIPRMRIG